MRMRLILIIALLFPVTACSQDLSNASYQYHPTPREVYDDCVKALEIAKTDKKAFMRTYCVAQIHGGISVAIHKYWVLPPLLSGDASECEKCKHQGATELYEQVEGRYCMPPREAIEGFEMPELYLVTKIVEGLTPHIEAYDKKSDKEKSKMDFVFSPAVLSLLTCEPKK